VSRGLRILLLLVLAAAFAAGLLFGAWWTIPAVAALYALVRRARSAPLEAAMAALLATLALLARQMLLPSFGRLLAQLGEVFPVPGTAVAGFTLLLAVTLAFTSARVVVGVAGVRD
jgi:hypothetical protein